MSTDRRARIEAARDRFQSESLASPVVCLLAEAEGVALDLARMAQADSGAGARGGRVLASITDALGAPEPMPFVLAIAGDGSPIGNALAALAHAVRSERIETGADDLAVGFPWLSGRLADGTLVRAPLFLYPATLGETLEGPWAWTLEIGGAPWLNEPLIALFRRHTRVRLSYEDFLAHDEDGLFKCDAATWHGFVKTLQRGGVTLADTAAELPAVPEPFASTDAAALGRIPAGQLRLQHHLVLGRFPMSSAGTSADYDALLGTSLDGYNLAGASALFDVDPDEPGLAGRAPARAHDDAGTFGQLRRWQVLPTDPWQEDALRSIEDLVADNDSGLVVLGAPGTGRSQLVANLVAGAIYKGLKVLVASPRRAALDDVAWRLAEVGLGEPLALVHDAWRDRNALCHGVAESVDPIVSGLAEQPESKQDVQALTGIERALVERLERADASYDALTGRDGTIPGLAELDEASLGESFAGLPDLSDCVAEVTRAQLTKLLPTIAALAPDAARYLAPHPLAARVDWGPLTTRDVARFYEDIAAARAAIERWAKLSGVLPAPELDRQRRLFTEDAWPIVELALRDDPEALVRHAEVIAWLEEPTPQEVHTRFLEEVRAASAELEPVPAELVRLPKKELAERLQSLDKLDKMLASGLRHVSPAFWSLKKLPDKITATLPPETPKEPAALIALHREAEKWQRLLDSLPDEPAFALAEVGDPALVRELVQRLDTAFSICRAEERVVIALAANELPPRPDWIGWLRSGDPFVCAASPFLCALVDEHARIEALDAVYRALTPLEAPLSRELVAELRAIARDRPAAAEARLAALAGTADDGPRVLALDHACARLPSFVPRFLRVWGGGAEEAARACERAVEEGWRALRLRAWGGAGIESALVDPRELRALAETMGKVEAARVNVVLGRWRERVFAQTELESQRQDLIKLVNETGRKRLRATLKQIVERYWKRGLATLRPVWFTPLDAVASIFPRDRDAFDLVVIDEAHRAALGDALPALLRGRRVLVLGDPCQAPPAVPAEAGAELALDSYRSILPLARGVWPQTGLWWAWGARREGLWIFPNAAAYAGAVQVVPNAEKRGWARSEGLKWVKVEGRWHHGTNKVEAEKVIDLIKDVLGDRLGEATPSVGVVAFTKAQAALIRRLLDRRAARDEELRALLRRDRERPETEQLAIGDLFETPVDTRDVIIVSVTYATTETSKRLQTELGQLGAPDGENFLTGVVTRARAGLAVVCSFHDVALDAGRQGALGVKVLDALLGYAQGITLGDERIAQAALSRLAVATGIEVPGPEPVSGVGERVRDMIAEPLGERGLGVAIDPLLGPVAPDMTVAPTQKSAARVAIQTMRFLREPDTLVRDVWARRFWQRQGWMLVRVTPGVWRAGPSGVIRSLEKLFSLPPRADQKIAAAAEKRLALEQHQAELAQQRLEEGLRWAAEAEAAAAARWAEAEGQAAETVRLEVLSEPAQEVMAQVAPPSEPELASASEAELVMEPVPEPEVSSEPEAAAPEPEVAPEPEAAAPEPEVALEPEAAAPEPEAAPEPAPEPEVSSEPEAAAPEPEAALEPAPEVATPAALTPPAVQTPPSRPLVRPAIPRPPTVTRPTTPPSAPSPAPTPTRSAIPMPPPRPPTQVSLPSRPASPAPTPTPAAPTPPSPAPVAATAAPPTSPKPAVPLPPKRAIPLPPRASVPLPPKPSAAPLPKVPDDPKG